MNSLWSKLHAFPWGILAIIVVFCLVEPLTHVWIQYFPPEGAVHTGMHVGDSAISQHYMDSVVSGFYSPYVSEAHRPDGRDYRLYMPPHALLYGFFGILNRWLGMDPFLYLGMVNGLGCALYLIAAYWFLREIMPRYGQRAFILFCLGGGLGGMAFLLCWFQGWVAAPGFEVRFLRLAHYELIEGQHLSPLLLSTRIYYTIPLAAGIHGLTLLVRGTRRGLWRSVLWASLLMAFAGFVNLRLGPLFWALAMAWVVVGHTARGRDRALTAAVVTASLILAASACWGMMSLNYHMGENLTAITSMAAWLIPLLTATVFFWAAILPLIRVRLARYSRGLQCLIQGALGYLCTYTVLYLGYMAYFGNWLHGGDTAAAIAVSDWALLGGIAGAVHAWWPHGRHVGANLSEEDRVVAWLLVWLLGFTAVSLSAFGQGWFLRFTPQRLMVLLPLPLAGLAALGLAGLPRMVARPLWVVLVGCGVASLTVATLYFQGPLGRQPGKGPFAYLHYEYVTQADADLMDRLPPGTVLSPPWSPIYFGEILSLRPGLRVLGGGGAAALSERRYVELQPKVNRFFAPDTSAAERHAIMVDLGVRAVFCPDTCPVDEAVLKQLDGMPSLRKIATAGRGRVYLMDPTFHQPRRDDSATGNGTT